ncbi:hypothetical protein ACFU76_18485 [Streptomyces sp. NPDC057539]|uniref:hypothetical protein n=1 Tax=Streptomyces sp. NPDC057539 TaxID=3346159 RepID=UPI0036BB0B1E
MARTPRHGGQAQRDYAEAWHPVRETFEPLPCQRLIRLDRRDVVGVFVLEKEAAWGCEVLRQESDSSQTHVKRSNLTCSHSDR